MAGHSHSANIKYRKDRQDSARSKLFLKLRKKIENIIRKEREVNEKVLSMAQENNFPKEKVHQIWEKIKNEKESNSFSRTFWQAPFGIFVYCEGNISLSDNLANKLKLKKLPLALLPNYFQLLHSLKLSLSENKFDLAEYLLTSLPSNIWEKINYDEKTREINSADKEVINRIKTIIKASKLELAIVAERSFWKTLIPCQLTKKEEMDYYQELEERLIDSKFYTNVEK